jgi:hypothetical protein
MITTERKLILKSGISLFSGLRSDEYLIGTLRKSIAIYGASAPAIFSALKRGANSAEIAATFSLAADQLADLVEQLHDCEFLETQLSTIQISERANKARDHSKDASYAQMKKRISPELSVTRWLPGVFDSGVSKVSARQSAHLEISGDSRVAQHLFAALISSGVTNTQFAPSFRRGNEQVSELDLIGGYISATDIGQVFTTASAIKSKSLALFPMIKAESAEELPYNFSEKIIKIHFGEIDPEILGLWMASGQDHLIISEVSGGFLTVSPIVKPGISPCSRCCDLTIADQSGATLLEGERDRDEMPIAGAIYLAGLIAAELIKLIDTGSCSLSSHALSIDLLDLCNTKHIGMGRHPKCGCGWR